MVATDSYRLSVKETPARDGTGAPFEANVPARALQELSRVVGGDPGRDGLDRHAQDNQVVFGIDGVTLSSRLIDGQFPNYRQLLPGVLRARRVGRRSRSCCGVVRRVSLMAQRNAPLRLRFEQGTVTLSAQTPDVGEASESVPVELQGRASSRSASTRSSSRTAWRAWRAEEVRLQPDQPAAPGPDRGGRAAEEEDEVPLPDHARAPQRLSRRGCRARRAPRGSETSAATSAPSSTCADGMTVLDGPVGAGKTNLLEAVHVGCIGRSFRTSNERELMRFGERRGAVAPDVPATAARAHDRGGARARRTEGCATVDGAARRPHSHDVGDRRSSCASSRPTTSSW